MELRFYDPAITPVMKIAAVTDRAVCTATDNIYGNGTLITTFPASDDASGRVMPRCIAVVGETPYTVTAVTRDEKKGKITVTASELLESLDKTLIEPSERFTGVPGNVISQMINAYSPYPMTVTLAGTGDNTLWITNFDSLYGEIKTLLDSFRLMTHTTYTGSGLALHITSGTDKTGIILSPERGTANIIKKTHDIKDYANKAIVYASLDPYDYIDPEIVTASECSFGDGIVDADYGTREIGVYKFADRTGYIYETADGYNTISRAELMRREGKAALAAHRPKIIYEAELTEVGETLGLLPCDRVTIDGRAASVISRTRTDGKTVLTLRV